ncbi:hypothetical protein MMC22_004551 [Lobaria immixta]|nr:hypothetical protein [Lobaria immixta]
MEENGSEANSSRANHPHIYTDAINRRIVQGLLQSDKIVRRLSDIPCGIIQTLEKDAGEAKKFIDELEDRKVPTIIQHLPEEVIGIFSNIVGIFGTLPSQIVGEAKAAVTDAVHVFNDIGTGAITSDLAQIPGVVVADITKDWGDLTSGLVDDWNAAAGAVGCFFGDCPVATTAAGSCGSTQAITAQSFPTQTSPAIKVASGLKIDSTILRLNIFQLCCILGLGSLGVIFWL